MFSWFISARRPDAHGPGATFPNRQIPYIFTPLSAPPASTLKRADYALLPLLQEISEFSEFTIANLPRTVLDDYDPVAPPGNIFLFFFNFEETVSERGKKMWDGTCWYYDREVTPRQRA